MAKRILIVSYHFYPEAVVGAKRMSELARQLCQEGHEVVVVAAKPPPAKSDQSLVLDLPGLRQIRLPQPPKLLPTVLKRLKRLRGQQAEAVPPPPARPQPAAVEGAGQRRESWLARLKRYYFSLEWLVDDKKLWAALVAVRLCGFVWNRPFDAVISSGPPMSAHLAVLLAKPVLRCRWILDLRDPWCDQDQRNEVESAFSRRCNQWLERRAVTAADVVTVTTPSYQQLLSERYPERSEQLQLVLNGFDRSPVVRPAATGRLQLVYAGSLYYNRDPFPLLHGVRELLAQPDVDRSRVLVRLVGDCDDWNGISITGWIERHGMRDCIQIEPWVPAEQVPELLAEANVLLSFAQGQPMQIPAKMFDYLAARREVLLITEPNSDTAWLARQSGWARIVPPGDSAAMRAALAALYQDYAGSTQARAQSQSVLPLEAFSRRAQNARFLELLHAGEVVEQEVGP